MGVMETMKFGGICFIVQILLGIILYGIIIGILIRNRKECFKGSYYTISVSLGVADVLSASNVLILIFPLTSTESQIWLSDNPVIYHLSSSLANIMDSIVITHLLTISLNRMIVVGFPTSEVASFVTTHIYTGICISAAWGHGLVKMMILIVTGCTMAANNVFLPVDCGPNNIEKAKTLYSAIMYMDIIFVGICVILNTILFSRMRTMRKKVGETQPSARQGSSTAEIKLVALSMFMTFILLIPYSCYLIVFFGPAKSDILSLEMLAIEGYILTGVGNCVFHILFNSLVREKLWDCVRHRKMNTGHSSLRRHRSITNGGAQITVEMRRS